VVGLLVRCRSWISRAGQCRGDSANGLVVAHGVGRKAFHHLTEEVSLQVLVSISGNSGFLETSLSAFELLSPSDRVPSCVAPIRSWICMPRLWTGEVVQRNRPISSLSLGMALVAEDMPGDKRFLVLALSTPSFLFCFLLFYLVCCGF
jgi:hypothetical protein